MNLTGAPLYAAACAACHGDDGAGKTFDKDGNKITTPSLHWGDLTKTFSTHPAAAPWRSRLPRDHQGAG